MSNDFKTGQENLAQAYGYTKKSILSLRFSPEWESVQRHVRRAIEAFKPCGKMAWKELLESYTLAIEAFEHTGSYQQCAVYSDERGDLLMKYANEAASNEEEKKTYLEKGVIEFKQAAKYQRLHGNNEKNVTILLKASKCLSDSGDVNGALQLAQDACNVYENDNRLIGAEKNLIQVLQMLIAAQEWQKVIQWLQYEVKILNKRRDMYKNSILHCYLGEVVILLYLKKYDDAFKRMVYYEDEDEDFMHSEHRNGAKALIGACNSDDTEALVKARKDWPIMKYLERDIALLVPKLELNPEYCGYNTNDGDSDDESSKKLHKEKGAHVDASSALADDML